VDAPPENWPRRLLHVPTMESYEWKPGNVYGDFQSPPYNILTYTWGRWALLENQHPELKVLKIEGISWVVPRVHPNHFTSDQFQRVIDASITTEARNPSGWLINHSRQVKLLWLDIACIDQDHPPSTIDEIGRQAQIFFQAEETFIWLTQLDAGDLRRVTSGLEACFTGTLHTQDGPRRLKKRLHVALDSLEKLLSDPWFSSLWTLQEAYLRPDAILLSRNGVPVPHNAEKHYTLLRLCQRASVIYHICLSNLQFEGSEYSTVRRLSSCIRDKIEKMGLAALGTQNPLAVYGVAQFRRSVVPEDRFYGIQQIFQF
jgi:hypothetical protein